MSDIEQIELSLNDAKELVARRDSILKLRTNRDFRKIILDGYFKDEAVRLTSLTAAPGFEKHRDDVFLSIQAISLLQQYLQTVLQLGDTAAKNIEDYNAELELLRAEAAGA
jgi:hypothetical protein